MDSNDLVTYNATPTAWVRALLGSVLSCCVLLVASCESPSAVSLECNLVFTGTVTNRFGAAVGEIEVWALYTKLTSTGPNFGDVVGTEVRLAAAKTDYNGAYTLSLSSGAVPANQGLIVRPKVAAHYLIAGQLYPRDSLCNDPVRTLDFVLN